MTIVIKVETTAVVGAGVMGANIAQALASGGFAVRLHDIDPAQLERALAAIEHGRFGLRRGAADGKLTEEQAAAALARIVPTTDLGEACSDADLVVEAVPEDLALKMKLFQALDRACPEETILTSNTSGLPITALAYATGRPDRVLGWHWAQPAPVLRFAELIVHGETASEAVDTVAAVARACGKNPIVVRDEPRAWGFVVNRVNAAVLREAQAIVDDGVATREQVDALVKDCLRWPMGPFEMQDHAAEGFEHAGGEARVRAAGHPGVPGRRKGSAGGS